MKRKAADTYETEITLTGTLYGREFTVEDVAVTVTYEFEPGEKSIMYGDNACPGSAPEVTISTVIVDETGEDVTEQAALDSLSETIAESLADDEDAAREDAAERRAEERRHSRLLGGY